MFITRRRIIEKIDPELLNPAGMNKQDLYRVILYAKDYAQCRRRLEQLGVHVLRELPIISGYVVDVPGNAVIRLAECQGVSYIAADVETEIQMNVAAASSRRISCIANASRKRSLYRDHRYRNLSALRFFKTNQPDQGFCGSD